MNKFELFVAYLVILALFGFLTGCFITWHVYYMAGVTIAGILTTFYTMFKKNELD